MKLCLQLVCGLPDQYMMTVCMGLKMVNLGAASVVPYVHQDQVQLLQACKARYSFEPMASCSISMTKCTAFCIVIAVRGAGIPENVQL